ERERTRRVRLLFPLRLDRGEGQGEVSIRRVSLYNAAAGICESSSQNIGKSGQYRKSFRIPLIPNHPASTPFDRKLSAHGKRAPEPRKFGERGCVRRTSRSNFRPPNAVIQSTSPLIHTRP